MVKELIEKSENGKFDLKIVLDDNTINEVLEYMDKLYDDFKNDDYSLYVLYTDRESTLDEVESDIEFMKKYLNSILDDFEILRPRFSEIVKKKNGSFYKGRYILLNSLESCCDYYTDFTNAWNVPCLRLNTVSDTECRVEFYVMQYTS